MLESLLLLLLLLIILILIIIYLIFQGHTEQWIDFASMEIDANISGWVYPRMGYRVYLPPVSDFVSLLSIIGSFLPFPNFCFSKI